MKTIQSPLNYTGGKYKLLSQILPFFPKDINCFIDLFCGGANVGCNVNCNHIVFNDLNQKIIQLLQLFKYNDKHIILHSIHSCINKYDLSWVCKNGYDFYNCTSDKGVGNYNKQKFCQLRNDFNKIKPPFDFKYYIMLYVLIVFSFNNQIRFNNKGEFNLPVGKRDFNFKLQTKLNDFIDRLQSISCSFYSLDFRKLATHTLAQSDFVYCDPPYLITCATYNENGQWTTSDETDLLSKLDELNSANIRFALSNVLRNKGKENTILLEWLKKNSHYNCISLNYNYYNSNYHTTDKTNRTEEVLITNYQI